MLTFIIISLVLATPPHAPPLRRVPLRPDVRTPRGARFFARPRRLGEEGRHPRKRRTSARTTACPRRGRTTATPFVVHQAHGSDRRGVGVDFHDRCIHTGRNPYPQRIRRPFCFGVRFQHLGHRERHPGVSVLDSVALGVVRAFRFIQRPDGGR